MTHSGKDNSQRVADRFGGTTTIALGLGLQEGPQVRNNVELVELVHVPVTPPSFSMATDKT